MVRDLGHPAYQGYLNEECVTIAEALRPAGYRTVMAGKWHVGGQWSTDPQQIRRDAGQPGFPTPLQRGFERFFGTLAGAGSYFHPHTLMLEGEFVDATDSRVQWGADETADGFYYTDAIGRYAAGQIVRAAADGAPLFLYAAYTAPHWPLHALPEDLARYRGRYREGWDALRAARHARLKELGVVAPDWPLTPRDPEAPDWDALSPARRDWEDARMAAYAAQVEAMDRSVGRIVAALRDAGRLEHTLLLFLSDNGGCAEFLREDGSHGSAAPLTRDGRPITVGNREGLLPGPPDTYMSYDLPWANASNTPFRRYKHWVHEGGIATPLIAHWPAGTAPGSRGGLSHSVGHLIDVLPTILDATGTPYPAQRAGHAGSALPPPEGESLLPLLATGPLVAAPGPGVLGARGEPRRALGGRRRGAREVEAGLPAPGAVGAVRHAGRPHGAARPRRGAAGAGAVDGRRVGGLGGALRGAAVGGDPPRPARRIRKRTPVTERPNIILIITDQQRYDTIGALGFPYARTPHLDRLVREGVAFTGCYAAGASCAPSRASLFSGSYPHTAGVMRNADPWRTCWVEDLARAGYHCVNVGKMHTYPFEAPSGFHERFVVENKDRYLEGRYFFDRWDVAFQAHGLQRPGRERYRQLPDYAERLGAISWDLSGAPEHLHSDVYVGGLARWWVEQKPSTRPLFLQVGFPGPHPPYDPLPRYLEQYEGVELPLPQVTAAEIEALPAPLRTMRVHNTEVDHDFDPVVARPVPGAAAATVDALPGQRDHDRRAGGGLAGRPGRGRLPRGRRGHLHLRPRRLPGRPRADPEVDDARLHHPRPVRRLVAQPLRRGPAGDGAVAADGPRPGPAGAGGGAGARVLGGRLHGARPAGRSGGRWAGARLLRAGGGQHPGRHRADDDGAGAGVEAGALPGPRRGRALPPAG